MWSYRGRVLKWLSIFPFWNKFKESFSRRLAMQKWPNLKLRLLCKFNSLNSGDVGRNFIQPLEPFIWKSARKRHAQFHECFLSFYLSLAWISEGSNGSCVVTDYWIRYITAWKVSVFGVFLVRIFPHLDWTRRDTSFFVSLRIQSKCGKRRTRKTPNMDTFYAVYEMKKFLL